MTVLLSQTGQRKRSKPHISRIGFSKGQVGCGALRWLAMDNELSAVLPPAYLSKKLTPPTPTKDGGTLRTILEACEYMAAIGKERELRPHWRKVRELILQEA